MSFSVATVLRESLRRLFTGPALLLALALAVVETVVAVVLGPVYRVGSEALSGAPDAIEFAPAPLSLLGLALVVVVAGYVGLVTTRVYATEWGIVEREHLTRSVAAGLANWIVGASLLGALVAAGLALLVVPGVFVLAAGLLALPFVAVEGENAATALGRSWRASSADRVALVGLAVAVLAVDFLLFGVALAVGAALDAGLALLGLFAGSVAVAVALVFAWIAMARAYGALAANAAA
ncbi:hypothetical protein BRC90_02455 [Halobacteriales archaeon QS_4_69_34]|nr:MAG: hypothetical protein BRC90_02455 [Halobacteriales archaeon QS_4_69_34]